MGVSWHSSIISPRSMASSRPDKKRSRAGDPGSGRREVGSYEVIYIYGAPRPSVGPLGCWWGAFPANERAGEIVRGPASPRNPPQSPLILGGCPPLQGRVGRKPENGPLSNARSAPSALSRSGCGPKIMDALHQWHRLPAFRAKKNPGRRALDQSGGRFRSEEVRMKSSISTGFKSRVLRTSCSRSRGPSPPCLPAFLPACPPTVSPPSPGPSSPVSWPRNPLLLRS